MTTSTTPLNPPTVSWDPPDPGEWALEAAHGSQLMPVTGRDQMVAAFTEGMKAGTQPYGLPLSHAEMQIINGWPYVSFFLHDVPRKAGPPPPDFVIKAISRLHPGFRRRTKVAKAAIAERRAQRVAEQWFTERDRWIERLLELQRVDLDALDERALADHLAVVVATAEEALRRHFELVFTAIPLGHWLQRSEQWGLPRGPSRSAVMHSTPVHDEARQRIDRIVDALGGDVPPTLEEIRGHSAEAGEALDDYLEYHGGWSTSDSPRSTVLQDHPETIVAAIAARGPGNDRSTPGEDPAATLAELRSRVPAAERQEFDRVASDAHNAHRMLDDNSGILGAWSMGILGTALRHVALRLVAAGRLHDADDLWGLSADQVVGLLGDASLDADDVARLAADWRAQGELDPPRHLGAEPTEPPDVNLFPAPVAHLMGAALAFIDDKFNEEHAVLGIGTESVQGRAVVVEHADEALDRLEPGDILVTIATTPAYNTVLGIVGGLVVSEGGLARHAAVVARELGVPTVVGYADATTRIADGAPIELDPVAATVTVLD